MEEFTQDWQEYLNGIDFKNQVNLYNKVNKAERFYSGDQWNGVVANGLPTPVLNIIKRIIQWKVSQIMSQSIKYQYSIDNIADDTQDQKEQDLKRVSEIISDYSVAVCKKVKQEILNEKILLKGAISGGSLLYDRWDPNVKTYQDDIKGAIKSEIVSSANYYPSNPNDTDVQSQQCIRLVFRELVDNVRKEAKSNGISDDEIEKIVSDDDTTYLAGDVSKIEVESKKHGKCLVILAMYKKDEEVWFRKSTKSVLIQKDTNSRLSRYPVALFNWDEREASAYGEGEAYSLIDNQISINKLLAMAILSTMNAAYPKCVYNEALVGKPNNQVGACIPIKGGPEAPLKNVIDWTTPGEISQDVYKIVDILIQQTKEMNGATEVAMGEVKPDNTSAFIAVNQASIVPLESVQRRFYNFEEDVALNRLDMMLTYYNEPRKLQFTKNGQNMVEVLKLSDYKDNVAWNVSVDVGPSSRWSEVASMQTLDKLLESEKITFIEWLERVPKGIVPKLKELLELRKQQAEQEAQMAAEQAKQQAMQQQQRQQPQQPNEDDMVQFVKSLPQDMQQQISSIEDDEEQRQVILQLMQESQQAA